MGLKTRAREIGSTPAQVVLPQGSTVQGERSQITPEEREKYKANKSTADTLKQGMGTGWDIDMLFTALATASGLEARFTRTSDRGIATFTPDMANGWFDRCPG